jgi:fatty acid kinase fatty acid binding subunit
MKIAVVTDSASDIPRELARESEIRIVPCFIQIDDQEYEDGNGLSREKFYRDLPAISPPPTTAAPSIGMFEQLYGDLLDGDYNGVISIHPATLLSGIYNAAYAASLQFEGKVKVFDSMQASMGLGYQVLAASRIVRTDTSFESLIDHLTEVQSRVRVVAMLDSLEYLRRSGRVSWVQANIGSLLSIKTFIELRDGRVSRIAQVRTRRKAVARLQEMILNFAPLDELAVLHSGSREDAEALRDQLAPRLGIHPLVINITTIIGTHVGPDGLGCAVVLSNS